MKSRLGALLLVVLTAVATALSGVLAVAAPAGAGTTEVDITPPAVGSCYALTAEEAWADSVDEAPVSCSGRHTTRVIKVHHFATAPDWSFDALRLKASKICSLGTWAGTGTRQKRLALSMYTGFWFIPTEEQRAAGATWVRCDIALSNGRTIVALPQGELLPQRLPRRASLCLTGRGVALSCDRAHAYRAVLALKYPTVRYPGFTRVRNWTYGKCRAQLGRVFWYEWPTRENWTYGYPYSVCHRKTRN